MEATMSNANDGLLWFEAPERTEKQLVAGLAAAHRVLFSAGVWIEEAYAASWRPEAIQFSRKRMSMRDWELFNAWMAAQQAANEAAGLDPDSYEGRLLFPAGLGIERNAEMLARLARGGNYGDSAPFSFRGRPRFPDASVRPLSRSRRSMNAEAPIGRPIVSA
jgi:hypothetical protein